MVVFYIVFACLRLTPLGLIPLGANSPRYSLIFQKGVVVWHEPSHEYTYGPEGKSVKKPSKFTLASLSASSMTRVLTQADILARLAEDLVDINSIYIFFFIWLSLIVFGCIACVRAYV